MISNPTADRVRIGDFSDREILAILNDLAGKASAAAVAARIFGDGHPPEQTVHLSRCVTQRFVWMRRYGLLDRAEDGEWEISAQGERQRSGKVSDTIANGIGRMADDSALNLGNIVGLKLVASGEVAGRAMQRELVHQIKRRRARTRGW